MDNEIEKILNRLEERFGYFENNEKQNVMPEVKKFLAQEIADYGEWRKEQEHLRSYEIGFRKGWAIGVNEKDLKGK